MEFDFSTKEMQELEARRAEIVEQATEERTIEELNAFKAEKKAIDEEIAKRQKAEAERRTIADAIAHDAVETVPVAEKREETKMENIEIRNTKAYIDAFANYVKTGDDTECRALLTDGVTGGTVPVPEFVTEVIAERLKASPILSRVRRMNVRGNVKASFELSAPIATAHTEGGTAVTEEALTLGIVTMIPKTMKKWVSFSDEVADNSEEFLRYIYDEITRGIIKAREKAVIDAILNAPQTATATAPAVAKTGSAAGAITDLIDARALLSDAAEDVVVIVSPADYAKYKGLQFGASYGVDPFDGHFVIISNYATVPIVGDLGGVIENMPKGDEVEFKYDDTSLMTSDMIRLLGRQPAAIALVGNMFFAKVSA